MNFAELKIGNLTAFITRYVKEHHIRRGGFVAAAAAVAVLFFIVGAFIRLLVGPVSLGPFSDRISAAVATALPGLTVRYDQAALEWSREDNRINIVVLGARVFDPDGRIIAQAPKAELALAAGPLIWHGKFELRRIALVGVQLTLVRTREGGLRLGVEKGHGDDILKRITDAINTSNSAQSSLQTFAVRNARIAFLDEQTGLFLVAPRADLQVATVDQDLHASVNADIEISGKPTHVELDVKLPNGSRPVSGTLAFSGLSLDALGRNAKAFAALRGINLVTDMSSSFVLAPGNKLKYLDFELGGSGTLAVRGLIHGPLRVKTLRVVGKYDDRTGRLLVDDIELSSNGVSAKGQGEASLVRDETGVITRIGFDLAADKIGVNMPGVFQAPFKLNEIALRGAYIAQSDEFDLDHFGISGGPFSLAGNAAIVRAGNASPAIRVSAKLASLPVRDLLHYWPETLAPGAWHYVEEHMKSGTVGPSTVETHISAGALDGKGLRDDAVNAVLPMSNVSMTYFHQFTTMTNVQAVAKLTGNTFSADIASARVGDITLVNGHAVIANLSADENFVDITAHVDGRMSDILTLIDMDPLHYATRFHLDPKDTLGVAGLDVSFHVPTRHDAGENDVKIGVNAAIKGLDLALTPHIRISNGNLTLTVDNDHLTANGTVGMFGSHLAASWTEMFKVAPNAMSSHITLKGTLDDATREALNFDTADYLKGTVGTTATLLGKEGQIRHLNMTLDLTPGLITVPYIGITKLPGVAGSAAVVADFTAAGLIQSVSMKITGTSLSATGGVSFDTQGNLTQLSFPSVREGTGNDFTFLMTRNPKGGSSFSIHGHSLDGTHIGQGSSTPAVAQADAAIVAKQDDDNDPFHISVRVDRLVLHNDVSVEPFALDVSGIGDRPQAMSVTGLIGKSQVTGSITAGEGGRQVKFDTDETGQLLNGFFGFTGMKGGTLTLVATLPGRGDVPHSAQNGPDFQGTMTVTNFKIVNQPFFARLFAAGSLGGLAGLLGGKGIQFDKATLPFSSRNDVITINGARASSGSVGMTADGIVDRNQNQIALKGSLVPLFGLNSVLGAIPILGNLLVSKKGEGIIGMTYSATGNADEPKISINPLSMLAPGIFRRIFEGRIPADVQLKQLPQAQAPVAPASTANDQNPAAAPAAASPASKPSKKKHRKRKPKPA